MSNITLPVRPNLEQLKKQAKELLEAVRQQNPDVVALVTQYHPAKSSSQFALHDAQLVLSRQYGFPSWAKLKEEVERRNEAVVLESFKQAVEASDGNRVRQLLKKHPGLHSHLNDPLFSFDSPAIRIAVDHKNRELIDVLLEAGADINKRSEWQAGSFGVLDNVDADLGEYLISHGAKVDIHAAAGLGKISDLTALLRQDPSLSNARGGDGGTPLHFAKNVAVIDILLSYSADVTIRDLDHGSTAAMWQIQDRANLYRLIEAGSPVDIFMACRHGDIALAKRTLKEDPAGLSAVVGRGKFTSQTGGDIYIWKIRNGARPISVASHFQHKDLVDYLLVRATPIERLIFHCITGDGSSARKELAENPALFSRLTVDDQSAFPNAVWFGNASAIRIFLSIGFPITGRGQDNGTALHIAAWKGDADTVDELLKHNFNLEDANNIHGSTPLGWACHGCKFGGNSNADHLAVVKALLSAGADATKPANKFGESLLNWASPDIAELLKKHGARSSHGSLSSRAGG